MAGKLCFSTFNQAKGLERKVVMILCFDESYFEFYAKETVRDKCPNIMYVACSRAMEKLCLVHDSKKAHLSFVNTENMQALVNAGIIQLFGRLGNVKVSELSEKYQQPVTQFIRHLKDEVYDFMRQKVRICEIQAAESELQIPDKIGQNIGGADAADAAAAHGPPGGWHGWRGGRGGRRVRWNLLVCSGRILRWRRRWGCRPGSRYRNGHAFRSSYNHGGGRRCRWG
jgi:hypothetical protein